MTLWLAVMFGIAGVLLSRPRTPRRRLVECGVPDSEGIDTRTSSARPAVLAGLAVATALVSAGSPLPIAVVAAFGPAAIRMAQRARRRTQQREACRAAVVEVTFALAAELRAGRTSKEALLVTAAAAGPLEQVLSAAAATVAAGGSAAEELEAGAALPGGDRMRSVAAAWRVAEAAGGRVAVVLERLGEAMDRDDELRREMEAALAAPKATMVLLAGLPAIGLGLGQLVGAHPVHLLLYRPVGWMLLGGAVVLDALGVVVSRVITRWAIG